MNATIDNLTKQIESANTATVEGRQIVVNACKELYNLIEEPAHNAGCDWMLKGLYADLCGGNFAEPFMCEQKKKDFAIAVNVLKEKILPRL